MGAHNETCTDMEFIQLWGQLQSAQRMAEHLGITTGQSIYAEGGLKKNTT